MDANYIPEVLLRGGTVGLMLLIAVQMIWNSCKHTSYYYCALFAVGSAAYAITSSPVLCPPVGIFHYALMLLAMANCVFFWWCASALLSDDFKLTQGRLFPLVPVMAIYMVYVLAPGSHASQWAEIALQLLTIALTTEVVWRALAERRNDLLEKRRTFRVVFTLVVGSTFIIVSVIEIFVDRLTAPVWLTTLHAAELFFVSLGFIVWMLQPRGPLFEEVADVEPVNARMDSPEDAVELEHLQALMAGGFYTTEGLSIRDLADELSVPEHRLRRLINRSLGYRNFSAYLNSHRLSDARKILSDPEQARKQIAQIAFELGYGSITPFNRAFKLQEGMTPTAYRRAALTRGAHVSLDTAEAHVEPAQ